MPRLRMHTRWSLTSGIPRIIRLAISADSVAAVVVAQRVGRPFDVRSARNDLDKSFTFFEYISSLAKQSLSGTGSRRWRSAAGKVTVGLTSHWSLRRRLTGPRAHVPAYAAVRV